MFDLFIPLSEYDRINVPSEMGFYCLLYSISVSTATMGFFVGIYHTTSRGFQLLWRCLVRRTVPDMHCRGVLPVIFYDPVS